MPAHVRSAARGVEQKEQPRESTCLFWRELNLKTSKACCALVMLQNDVAGALLSEVRILRKLARGNSLANEVAAEIAAHDTLIIDPVLYLQTAHDNSAAVNARRRFTQATALHHDRALERVGK